MQDTDKIILGTVQLGVNYGINNKIGKPNFESAAKILNLAFENGIQILDSAEAYGNAHEVIGEYHQLHSNKFNVITKFSSKRTDLGNTLTDRVKKNIEVLNVDNLYAYMFHSYNDFETYYDAYKNDIAELKKNGFIKKFGVSIYTNEEFEKLLNYTEIDIIQIPFNVLDNLSLRGNLIEAAYKKNIEVHTRSAFLQGLFFIKPEDLPAQTKKLTTYINQLNTLCQKYQVGLNEVALNYCLQQPHVNQVLIGVETSEQLIENLKLTESKISESLIQEINLIKVNEIELLNPSNWKSMKVLAITQARTGSTRLPNKILKTVNNKTLLATHIERILKAKNISKLLVATTIQSEDDIIETIAKPYNLETSRGSVNDVLDRFYQAAKPHNPEWIVRLTSDCPLIDPELIDSVIEKAIELNVDYMSNGLSPNFPNGMDVEVFKFSALEYAWKNATLKSDREHVTPYIYRNSSYQQGTLFKSENFGNDENFEHVRLTVDDPEDFKVLSIVIEELGIEKDWKSYADFYLSNPEVKQINEHINRNEGYIKSLNND